jgi:diadenylate cyclase
LDEEAAEAIEEVITAAGMLAKSRIGAIIAIEREIGLRNYVESGIPIDGAISYDLLTAIFQPSSPLHDGAVIVQEDRVAAAACFLPLAVGPGFDRDLGTRHRAAIGLTEECDAVAVVFSEERGEISLSLNGRIIRGLSADELQVRLQHLILQRRMPASPAADAAEVED